VVTLSAPFGAGGSVIGPLVAERLEVPFLDRAIPVAVAEALAVPTTEALEHDERRRSGFGRALASLARAASAPDTVFAAAPAAAGATRGDAPEEVFREETERVLREIAETTGGVILGRAGAVVLRDHPRALHVRLTGTLEARITRAASHEGIDEATARRLLADTDRAREAYVRHFYKCDANDATLYHLVLDSTVLPEAVCADLVVTATRARAEAAAP